MKEVGVYGMSIDKTDYKKMSIYDRLEALAVSFPKGCQQSSHSLMEINFAIIRRYLYISVAGRVLSIGPPVKVIINGGRRFYDR